MGAPNFKLPPFPLSPILAKEMAGRMRSARAYAVLTIYLAVASGLSVLIYMVGVLGSPRTVGSTGAVGQVEFYFLVGMQLLLVSFVAPAFAAGAISRERENKTLEVLRMTPLTPAQIVQAKLISALGFTLLLLFATLPLFSLAFLLGGVEPRQLVIALCGVLASALLYTVLPLYLSTRFKTTASATLSAYAIVSSIVVGVPLAALIGAATIGQVLGPVSVLASLLNTVFIAVISLSPISAFVASEAAFSATGELWTLTSGAVGGGPSLTLPSPFLILTGVYLAASALLYALTVRRLARIEQQ
ncbi:MAG: hypothetical protein KatS3mg052_2259 [Candidatus Roseilinea sp.]|nr:MAG: hypothetical protein KatS3mg052_2259 [Candidatus Roseilinea sp.]